MRDIEYLRTELAQAFQGEFMKPEVFQSSGTIFDTDNGLDCVPEHLEEEDYEGEGTEIYSVEHGIYWFARLSAPGYLDCTEYATFASEEEAIQYLLDVYAD